MSTEVVAQTVLVADHLPATEIEWSGRQLPRHLVPGQIPDILLYDWRIRY